MRASLPFLLVLCESLLLAHPAVAAGKAPPYPQSIGSSHRRARTANLHGRRVAVLRQDAGPSSGTANRRGRPTPVPKTEPKATAAAPRAADQTTKLALSSVSAAVDTHRVRNGETLRQVAARYGTLEAVLRALNGFDGDESIRAGQIVFVPSQGKSPPARAESSNAAWRRYAKPPKEKGSVEISTYSARFAGAVVDKQGRLRPEAVQSLNRLLGAGGKHPPLPERLIRSLVKASDVFGGRSIHVVSGYRANSYYEDSRHRLSAAVDFTIAGVPNAVLCEYLRELDDVGVGYYPNSSFVHLDVRKESTYWVDYAGPGQPPRSTPHAPRPTQGSKRWLLAEIDALVNHTVKALEGTSTDSAREVSAPTVAGREPPPAEESTASSHGSSESVAL